MLRPSNLGTDCGGDSAELLLRLPAVRPQGVLLYVCAVGQFGVHRRRRVLSFHSSNHDCDLLLPENLDLGDSGEEARQTRVQAQADAARREELRHYVCGVCFVRCLLGPPQFHRPGGRRGPRSGRAAHPGVVFCI